VAIPLEVCIDSAFTQQAAKAAFEGGALRIELCSQMNFDGLTPSAEEIKVARATFGNPGLMVMIRPRAGDFTYTREEQKQMFQDIQMAKDHGADGVVLGALKENQIDVALTRALTQYAKSFGLAVTFHRAFDVVENRSEALEILIELGIDRVLTSGTSWKSKQGALEGLPVIKSFLAEANNCIEIIVGGGINQSNIRKIVAELRTFKNFSVHTYSGVQENGITSYKAVRTLLELIKKNEQGSI
jgi:copper homeostasis protein